MRAAWYRARSEIRARWKASLSLALLAGIGGGVILGTISAARRTDSAYPRFVERYRGADLAIGNFPGDQIVQVESAERIEGVEAVERFRFAALNIGGEFMMGLARSQAPDRAEVDAVKIISGRSVNPDRANEVVATLLGAEHGLGTGREFDLATFDEETSGDFVEFGKAIAARPLRMRVVGIAAAPGGFPPQVSEVAPMLYLTPAFFRSYPNAFAGVPDSAVVRLQPGYDLSAFRADLAKASEGSLVNFLDRRGQGENVQRSLHLQAVAMWLLGGMAAFIVALVILQSVGRQVGLESADQPVLAALGMRPSEQISAVVIRTAFVVVIAAALACGLAALSSNWTPFGLAGTAEPDPGVQIDLKVVGLGVIVIIALITGAAAATAAGVRRTRAARGAESPVIVRTAGRLRLPPAALAGVQFALDPGRGPKAVPVRTAMTGLGVAVVGLVATLTFAASLAHMLDEPRLYGVTWDLTIGADAIQGFDAARARQLGEIPGVDAVSIGNLSLDMLVNGKPVEGMAMEGNVDPAILQGRAPKGEGEVALGPRTLQRLDVHMGEQIILSPEGGRADLPMRIVGVALMASGREATRIGEGAVISVAAFLKVGRLLGIPDFAPGVAFLRLHPGTSISKVRDAAVALLAPGTKFDEAVYSPPVATPSDVVSFGKVRNLPFVLAGALGIFSAATLAHTLVTAIRRRRRDLAIMKTLGFVRRQVGASVGIQAAVMTLVALIPAVPIGIVAGRWAWSSLARDLGVINIPVVPVAAILLVVPASMALAILVALVPAAVAARTHPAAVLRTE